mgnify:FL=1
MSKEVNAEHGVGKKQSGFMQWYESYKGKRVVGMVYSIGAAVVIVGALFKIMHWPGAGPVLIMGMSTEVLLFLIGCLDKPHPTYHWEQVFPQLVGHDAEKELLAELATRPKPTLLGGGEGGGNSNGVSAPTLSARRRKRWKNSLRSALTAVR